MIRPLGLSPFVQQNFRRAFVASHLSLTELVYTSLSVKFVPLIRITTTVSKFELSTKTSVTCTLYT